MTKDEIKSKMQIGDYNTLGAMLECNAEAARKRFKRDNPEAIEAMRKIVEAREQMILTSKK